LSNLKKKGRGICKQKAQQGRGRVEKGQGGKPIKIGGPLGGGGKGGEKGGGVKQSQWRGQHKGQREDSTQIRLLEQKKRKYGMGTHNQRRKKQKLDQNRALNSVKKKSAKK